MSQYFLPSLFKLTGREGIYEDDILLFDFFWALCGGGGFLLREKVFLSLEIGARLEWQRTGGLLRTDTDERSSNHDGLLLLVYSMLSSVFCCVLRSAVYIAQNNP